LGGIFTAFTWLEILNLVCITLTDEGAILGLLQEAFVIQTTIKTPTQPSTSQGLTDITDLFTWNSEPVPQNDIVQSLRSALASTSDKDVQPYLWVSKNANCTVAPNGQAISDTLDNNCFSGTKFADLNLGDDPFIAQLPAHFNTGLLRQFLPRFSSSLTYDVLDGIEFPQLCGNLSNLFYAEYGGNDTRNEFSIQVCMPSNLESSTSPWQATRNAQTITELLYLNISMKGETVDTNSAVFKVQANSTAGYFELPNYLNGGATGPLLVDDPNPSCDEYCYTQGAIG
jgi:hypothetical protein